MDLLVLSGIEAIGRKAASIFYELSESSIASRGRFAVALSGGSTPKGFLRVLGSRYQKKVQWDRVEVFFADERLVPAGHEESNYRMVREELLSGIPARAHRVRAELEPEDAALIYEAEIRQVFGAGLPDFDLIVLGMGEDGHTASLFPGSRVLQETGRLAAPVYVERLKSSRITLTLPVINNARNIVFLVSGRSKARTLRRVLGGKGEDLPAARVRPAGGSLLWLVDEAAYSS